MSDLADERSEHIDRFGGPPGVPGGLDSLSDEALAERAYPIAAGDEDGFGDEPAGFEEPEPLEVPQTPGLPAGAVFDEGLYVDDDGQELPAPGTPEYAALENQAWEELTDLMADEPEAAAQIIGHLHAAQVEAELRAEFQQQFAPLISAHNQTVAAGHVEGLAEEFGEVFELHRDRLAAMIAEAPEYFADVNTRGERLRQAVAALEYDRLAGVDYGEAIKADMRDATKFHHPPPSQIPGLSRREAATLREQSQVRRLSPAEESRARKEGRLHTSVHVEGGSGPQPRVRVEYVDPVVAEMRAGAPKGRDIFGEIRR